MNSMAVKIKKVSEIKLGNLSLKLVYPAASKISGMLESIILTYDFNRHFKNHRGYLRLFILEIEITDNKLCLFPENSKLLQGAEYAIRDPDFIGRLNIKEGSGLIFVPDEFDRVFNWLSKSITLITTALSTPQKLSDFSFSSAC